MTILFSHGYGTNFAAFLGVLAALDIAQAVRTVRVLVFAPIVYERCWEAIYGGLALMSPTLILNSGNAYSICQLEWTYSTL